MALNPANELNVVVAPHHKKIVSRMAETGFLGDTED